MTEVENIDIVEAEGPPRVYFEVHGKDIMTGADVKIRLKYRTLAFACPDEDLTRKYGDDIIETIRNELKKYEYSGDAIIWWRILPSIQQIEYQPYKGWFQWRCRIETSPPLPDEFWNKNTPWLVEGQVPKIYNP
jgi:hypothetical protein